MGKKDLIEEFHLKVDNIFGVINFIKICSDVDKFRNWMKSEHGIKNVDDIFVGYKFFIESAIRTFLNTIIYNSSLDIEEDFVFYRARFTGVNISKIPNTCEKTILIKNIHERLRLIKKAKSWKELSKGLTRFKEIILDIFEKIFNDYVAVSPDINVTKEDALNYVTRFYAYIYLNDTSRFVPHGYWVSILDNELNPDQYKKNFKGYKYSLQYVWNVLLENKYYSTSIKNLHNSKDWSIEEPDIFNAESEVKNPELTYDDVLDSYFGKIQTEIIEPLEKDLEIKINFKKILYFKNKIPKHLLNDLLKSVREPKLNEKEKLDFELLWYQIEFLDSSKSHIFNGVPAFTSMLAGTAELKRIFGEGEKAYICKFIHPDRSVKGNDFSYGVLIEAFGSIGISDYSGWVLFFDCCGDYSGFSGSEHAMAEMFIDKYRERNLLEVREMVIDKNNLKKYVADKIVSEKREEILFELDEESKRRFEKDVIGEAKGLILELITYYSLSKNNYDLVDWNIKMSPGQLDVIFEANSDFILVECKYNPRNMDLDNEIKKLKRKLASYKTNKNKKCEFWFWDRPSQITIEKLTNAGINYAVISELIKKDPNWRNKELDKLMFIFDHNGELSGDLLHFSVK